MRKWESCAGAGTLRETEPESRILDLPMLRIFGTILAGLLGLAFGSFLNVCLSRWPEGESVVKPRSHCRNCGRTLTWWENLPVVSWIALRGRCRTCKEGISWRYPAVELAVGALWAVQSWTMGEATQCLSFSMSGLLVLVVYFVGPFAFLWLLVALAALDAENLWLPDRLTLLGTVVGIIIAALHKYFLEGSILTPVNFTNLFLSGSMLHFWLDRLFAILAPSVLILLIRWAYWLIRRREGIGLGDAKLMAMLGAWLGLSGALLSFGIGVVVGALFAVCALALTAGQHESENRLAAKLPLGTFLCIGGIFSALWGQPIIETYKRWAGL